METVEFSRTLPLLPRRCIVPNRLARVRECLVWPEEYRGKESLSLRTTLQLLDESGDVSGKMLTSVATSRSPLIYIIG